METTLNATILSLGGINNLNGSCPSSATDEEIEQFLSQISYVSGRKPITVQEVKDQFAIRQQQLINNSNQKNNIEALTYLSATDWYVIRQQETGKPIPLEILTARQLARDSIVSD